MVFSFAIARVPEYTTIPDYKLRILNASGVGVDFNQPFPFLLGGRVGSLLLIDIVTIFVPIVILLKWVGGRLYAFIVCVVWTVVSLLVVDS